jgi:predicted branched-subunit amino acid permease
LSFASPRAAAWGGRRDALSAPALVLGASYIGFGSLCRESGLTLFESVRSTASVWALPGQIVMAELYGIGASLAVIALAVAMTNARLLPMTATLTPVVRAAGTPRWRYFLAAHFVAVTAWTQVMQRAPSLPADQRLAYLFGFATTLWATTMVTTTIGFFAADRLPDSVSLGLVFLNPIYFLLVFIVDLQQRLRALALVFGAALGPPLHSLSPDWGLPLAGLIAGTAAFSIDHAMRSRRWGG